MALSVPLSRSPLRVGGGSAFFVRHRSHPVKCQSTSPRQTDGCSAHGGQTVAARSRIGFGVHEQASHIASASRICLAIFSSATLGSGCTFGSKARAVHRVMRFSVRMPIPLPSCTGVRWDRVFSTFILPKLTVIGLPSVVSGSGLGESTMPNKADAQNPAMTSLFRIGRHRRRVCDLRR